MIFNTIFNFFESTIGSLPFFLSTTTISFLLKSTILIALVKQTRKKIIHKSFYFLLLVLSSTIFVDLAWMLKLSHKLFFPSLDYKFIIFFLRLSWAASIVQYHSLSLFIESLSAYPYSISLRQKILIFTSSLFCLFFIIVALIHFNCVSPYDRSIVEIIVQRITMLYSLFIIMAISLFFMLKNLKLSKAPTIIKKQSKILLSIFTIILVSDFVQTFPLYLSLRWITNSYAIANISLILILCALFYSAQKMMGLRFLNIQSHVQSPQKIHFLKDFRKMLKRFSKTKHLGEFEMLTQAMFQKTFGIENQNTQLYIRKLNGQPDLTNDPITSKVESALSTKDTTIYSELKKTNIFIYDEIAFNAFYGPTEENKSILHFLENINADIFLPVYEEEEESIVAYIIIEKDARPEKLYDNNERDEMLVFAGSLGTIIDMIQYKNFNEVLCQAKMMKEDAYSKHQENNQFRESIKSFSRKKEQKEPGLIFYRNRRFTFGNKVAEDLIGINLNVQIGNPLTKELKKAVIEVAQYKAPKSILINDINGNKLAVSAQTNIEGNSVILSINPPDISDIIAKQFNLLPDPTQWDYLLYLETTKSGRLVNQLIPGNGETLLNFKITLLKAALSNKALLLDMHQDDIMDVVELLHSISLREKIHVLNVKNKQGEGDTITLCGINQLFKGATQTEPLLQQLDEIGTLFIKNIHHLSLTAQEHLAEYLRYGFFRMFKSEHRISSDVRIFCSSDEDLQTLVYEGQFSKKLFNEIQKTVINMPSLLTLPPEEIKGLATAFSEQLISDPELKHLLSLTNKDKERFEKFRPENFKTLREKVKLILIQKSKENNIYEETELDPTYGLTDPDLIEAIRLGKQVLKDPKMMAMLWKKFGNQSKIATFLGVNRSSIHRRFKKHDYSETEDGKKKNPAKRKESKKEKEPRKEI